MHDGLNTCNNITLTGEGIFRSIRLLIYRYSIIRITFCNIILDFDGNSQICYLKTAVELKYSNTVVYISLY